jgi:hypothetical protein
MPSSLQCFDAFARQQIGWWLPLYQSTDPIRPFCRQALLNWVIREWHEATKVITTEIRDFAAVWHVSASAGLKGTTQ